MNISKGAGVVILALCGAAASASGASAAELPGGPHGGLAPSVLSAPEPVVKAVRAVPGQVKDAALAPQRANVPMPERNPKAGDQRLDFGPFGILSARDARPDEVAMNAVGGAASKLSALTG
ncbi:MAG: hypothetical protein QOF84_3359 [Streptomyces sp.]|nr:hypothetical protein [Streptomyces sp.]